MHALLDDVLARLSEWMDWSAALPLWGAAVVALLGLVWLLHGGRLFRFLLVGLGALAGWGAGAWLAARFGVDEWWIALPLALLAGGLAWPLWQGALFVLGAALGLWIAGALLDGAELSRFEQVALWLVAAVGTGAITVWAMGVLAVVLTALLGAVLTLLGLAGIAADWVDPRPLLEEGGALWAALSVLTLVGLVVQAGNRRRIRRGAPDRRGGDGRS